MEWIEVVTVRTAGKSEFLDALDFFSQINQNLKSEKTLKVKLYRNVNYDMDLSIHFYRESGAVAPAKTACGIRLSKLLNRFGLVDHNVWQPVQMSGTRTDS